MTNQQIILTDVDTRIDVLQKAFKASRVAYNAKVYQVDTMSRIGVKGIKMIEKGLGLKLFCIEPIQEGLRLTFDIVK